MAESLKKQATKGVFWSTVERLSVQGVQFLVLLIMARMVSPREYGLLAMVAIFSEIAQTLIDSGFSQALIRKQNRTEVDNNTVFYFNIGVGLFLYLICFVCAPFVADFYHEPELVNVMRVICIGMIINSLQVVQRADYIIRLDFKTQAKASTTAAIVSGVIGIALAYLKFGVWALVAQQLLNIFLNAALLWWYSKWRPRLMYSWKSFHELFSFGWKLLVSGLLNTIWHNITKLVVGKAFSAKSLGQYSRASHFAAFPSSNLTSILQRVTYPVLCKIQDDDEKLASAYRRILKVSAFVIFPLMVLLSAVSVPLVVVLIGEKWLFCAMILQVVCFSKMWYPIHAINLNLLQVKGRSDLFLRLEIIKKIIGVIMICITIPMGLMALCYGQIIVSIINLMINTFYTGKLIHVGFFRQMMDLLPTLLICACMFGVVKIECFFISNLYIQLILSLLTGTVVHIGLSRLFKFEELKELKSLINNRRKKS